jgi:hypothetical protein
MIELYKHKGCALNHLNNVRINPDFNAKGIDGHNLEFLIPQLCSFYLRNDLNPEEHLKIVDFLIECSVRSLHFGHKLWFCLSANLEQEDLAYASRELMKKIEERMVSSILGTQNLQTYKKSKDPFNSTPSFIRELTELSTSIMPFENKMDTLKAGLKIINEGLPADVYIPFITQSIRNHAVLGIFVEESRIFVTR